MNGKPTRALADTGTIGGTLISNKFVTTQNIPYTARKNAVTLKMAVNGSRSTSNFSIEVIVTTLPIGSYSGLDSSPYGIPSGNHIENRPVYLVYYR